MYAWSRQLWVAVQLAVLSALCSGLRVYPASDLLPKIFESLKLPTWLQIADFPGYYRFRGRIRAHICCTKFSKVDEICFQIKCISAFLLSARIISRIDQGSSLSLNGGFWPPCALGLWVFKDSEATPGTSRYHNARIFARHSLAINRKKDQSHASSCPYLSRLLDHDISASI